MKALINIIGMIVWAIVACEQGWQILYSNHPPELLNKTESLFLASISCFFYATMIYSEKEE